MIDLARFARKRVRVDSRMANGHTHRDRYGDLSNTVQSTVLCGETVGRAGQYWVA